jgi:hypothetical protein
MDPIDHRGDEAQAGKEIPGDFVVAEAPQFNQLWKQHHVKHAST